MKTLLTTLMLIFILWLFSTGQSILIAAGVLFLVSLAGILLQPEWILEEEPTDES